MRRGNEAGAMQDDSGAAKMWQANYTITREGLRNGSHLAQLRARALPGFPDPLRRGDRGLFQRGARRDGRRKARFGYSVTAR